MMREDKKIQKALRSAPMPEPPEDLLEKILSQNGLNRSKPMAMRWVLAGCAATVLTFAIWQWAQPSGSARHGQLMAAKQDLDSPKPAVKEPAAKPRPVQRQQEPKKKVPKVLTGREPRIRIKLDVPKTYLASNVSQEPERAYITPLKIGKAVKGAPSTATASIWAQNERGVWVLTQISLEEKNGQRTSVVKKTESDRQPQKLLVHNESNDSSPDGGDNE